jgi:anti-sigma B factor antagonist
MTWRLEIIRTRAGDACHFRVRGRIGTANSGELVEALVGAVRDGETRMILDFSGVDYVSSAGLMALDAASGMLLGAGGTIAVSGLTEPVRLAFELAGLLEHFPILDVDAADGRQSWPAP